MVTEVPGQSYLRPQSLSHSEDILVTAATQIGENNLVTVHLLGFALNRSNRVGWF
jgi:hypothetical protein